MLEEIPCILRMRAELFVIFNRLYPVTDLSHGDGKGVIFLSFVSSL